MKANVNYRGEAYENVELTCIKKSIVAFRIYANATNYHECIEQLVNNGADVDFYKEYAFIIVDREQVKEIIYL